MVKTLLIDDNLHEKLKLKALKKGKSIGLMAKEIIEAGLNEGG
jgi:plasmid stability protein